MQKGFFFRNPHLSCLTFEKYNYICCMLQNTKQNIIDAAIFIFNEDLSAPLEKVADEAKVTRRTLHRYFTDRTALLDACQQDMQKSCSLGITAAKESSVYPLQQLEQILYAAINCGVKYSFLHKLHSLHNHQHKHNDKNCEKYDRTFGQIGTIIKTLQDNNVVSTQLSTEWIATLFTSIVTATINAHTPCADSADFKKFAWFSFSRGIGI